MKVVVIRKEIEYKKSAPANDTGKITESCMGIFPSFKAARKEIAAYLFDELDYLIYENNGNISISNFTSWKTRKEDDMSTLEVSMANMEYMFKAFFVDDEEDEESASTEEGE